MIRGDLTPSLVWFEKWISLIVFIKNQYPCIFFHLLFSIYEWLHSLINDKSLFDLYRIHLKLWWHTYFSFWLLGVESSNFSQVERERITCKTKQILKFTNWQFLLLKWQPRVLLIKNSWQLVNLLSFASSSFFLSVKKITWLNWELSQN